MVLPARIVAMLRRTCFSLVILGAVCVTTACNETNACGQVDEEILRADGGVYRCTQAEDCPRASNVFVCETDVPGESACVRCVETECIQNTPIPCS